MEQPSLPQENIQPTTPSIPASKPNNLLLIGLGALLLFSLGSTGLLFYQNNQLKKQIISQGQPTPTVKLEPSLTPQPEEDNWKLAKFGGFSYEYPVGWHVAELWNLSQQGNEIIIAIDQNPISNAPRGGPIATFMISVINGLPNPNEVFEAKKAEFNKENYTDITSETINSNLGPIYYYKGKVSGEMAKGMPVENYYLTFRKSETDSLNQQIIIATLTFQDDPKLSEMLRHIVTSIKQLN